MNFYWKKARIMMLACMVVFVIGGITGLLAVGGKQAYAAATSKWEPVGGAGFSAGETWDPSLFMYNGTPYAAYIEGNVDTVTVKKYNGSSWEPVGSSISSASSASWYTSLYVDNDTPYIAYIDRLNSDKVTVKKLNGSSWELVGNAGISANIAGFISLYVDNGTPYVAFKDYGNARKATVMTYNGSSWETVGSAGFSAGEIYGTSLKVDNGIPYVSYQDGANSSKATVMKYNGSSWEAVGSAGFTPGRADYTPLYIDEDIPYVAYMDFSNGGKATVQKYNGSSWETVGSAGFSANAADYPSLFVDNGTPYVAFKDGANSSKATVMKYNGNSWETVGDPGFSAGRAEFVSLDVYDGIPYVLYRDVANGSKVTLMKLKFTVAYAGNGSTGGAVPIDGSSYDKNANATVLGNTGSLVRTGHTFAGWNTAPDGTGTSYAAADLINVGASGVTLYARWTVNSYTVAYDGNGAASGTVPTSSSHNYNTSVTVPGNTGNLMRTGYTFAGWNTAANGSGTNYTAGGTFPIGAANVTLYARWTINNYTVSYDGNGATSGTVPASGTYNYNTGVTVPGNTGSLVKTGHTFAGWTTALDGSGTDYTASDTFTIGAANKTLYARWTVNSYTVTYDGNGAISGTAPAADSHNYNAGFTLPGNTGSLEKTGYTFAGWNTAVNGSGTNYAAGAAYTMGAANMTLYAKWTINSYTVTYDDNGSTGGSVPAASSHDYNTVVTVPGNNESLEKTGHTFAGWNIAEDGNGTNYAAADTFTIGTANVTLYAKWTINSYTVSYDGNGATSGTAPSSGSHVYNTGITLPDNSGSLEKTGHTFAGWNTAADGNGTNYSTGATYTMGAANVILYAKWTANNYTVTYNGNGNTGGSAPTVSSHVYNTVVTVPGNTGSLEKTGHTFVGWMTAEDGSGTDYAEAGTFTIGAEDMTLYAKWTINSYTVTYNGNGSTEGSAPSDSSHVYNTGVTVQGNTGSLEKTGHTFAGWNTAADGSGTGYAEAGTFTIGAADVTLYAKWTVNSYMVIYDGNGNTGGSAPAAGSYDYNTGVTVLGNTGSLEKTGHTFAGWMTATDGSGTEYSEGDPFTMGAANVTLYAKWTVNSYTVSYSTNGATFGSAPTVSSHVYGTVVTVPGNTGSLGKTGHTFAGWMTALDGSGTSYAALDTFTIGAANVTLYAKWAINSYTAGYDGNGATSGSAPAVSSHVYNTNVTVPGNTGSLVKTGHTFAGWMMAADGSGMDYSADDTFTIGAANVTLYAKWMINSYMVGYDSNGAASGGVPTVTGHVYNTVVTVPGNTGNLEKTGHTFAGWMTAADGSGTDYAAADTFTISAANVTLYAKWTVNSYTVTYDGNGATSGSTLTASIHDYNTVVTVPGNTGNLEKTGHAFAGWMTAADGSGTVYAASDTFTISAANVTLYAKWTVNSYMVTYDGNGNMGGRAPTVSSNVYNTGFTVSGNTGSLIKTGHTFAGWNTAADGSGVDYAADDTFTIGAANVTLYAKWTVNSYTVTYVGNGATSGSVPTVSIHDYNTGVTVPDNIGNLEKTGHTFAGWNRAADGSGTNYAADDTFTIGAADVTLHAKWTVNRYTVSFESNGGSPVSVQTATYGSTASKPNDPTKTGYTFTGWFADSGLTTEYSFTTAIMGDTTLYANWMINGYTVTYDGNGATSGSVPTGGSYDYNTAVTVQGNTGSLEKTGYTFVGWNTAADGSGTNYGAGDTITIGAAGMTLYAKWAVNGYTVTYNGNGATSGSVPTVSSHDYNTSVTVPGNTGSLVKTGYAFAGWNTAADGSGTGYGAGAMFVMGALNIELYAQWLNSNALLSGLSVDQGLLSPSFSQSHLYYNVDVDYTVSNLILSFIKADPVQAVSVTGAVYRSVTNAVYSYHASNFIVGSNPIQIRVNAQDGTANVYTVTVNRAPEPGGNADLSSLTLSNGTLSPVFAPGITAYTSNVANGVSAVTVKAGTQESSAAITVNGNTVASGEASGAINLNVGSNQIAVVVTAENGRTKIYTVTVNRASKKRSGGGGGGSTIPPTSTSDGTVISTDGNITVPAGEAGKVSLGDTLTISIPAGASGQQLKVTIEQVLDTQNLLADKDVSASPIYEILKNFPEDFSKPVTLTMAFDPASVRSNQRPAVFYFDEVNKVWVEILDGIINGNYITVKVDHFTKFAVFAVDQASSTSITEQPADTKPGVAFSDISEHWAEASIKLAMSGGIVTGYLDGAFKPDAAVTRAEFTVMLMKTVKLQVEGVELTFTDTAKIGAWARKAVAQAKHTGIINGYEDGTFRPDERITRAEMAVMLANALSLSHETSAAAGFKDDQDIPEWAKNAVGAIKKLGLVEGKSTNLFDPLANTTRAETVTLLLRAMERKNR